VTRFGKISFLHRYRLQSSATWRPSRDNFQRKMSYCYIVILQPCPEVQPEYLSLTSRLERRKCTCCSSEAITDHTPSAVRPLVYLLLFVRQAWTLSPLSRSDHNNASKTYWVSRWTVKKVTQDLVSQSPKTWFHSRHEFCSELTGQYHSPQVNMPELKGKYIRWARM